MGRADAGRKTGGRYCGWFLMADNEGPSIDALIARATPKVDFSPIGDLPKSYWEGLAQRSAQDQRDVFKKEGVPLTPDGSLDYQKMIQMFGRVGLNDKIIPLANAASTSRLVERNNSQDQPQPNYQPVPAQSPV